MPATTAVSVSRHRRKFILCFDGTGNKFSGTDADSNILKIYRLLDRNEDDQFHYYQPGIGTYIVTSSRKDVSHSGKLDRLKSWYIKAKDSAIGTSFAEHVMGGYKFLMRYYSPGDDIFFFGFSRGAYTARFLAEMLDHVGLLSAGNEEMCRSILRTFQRWQCRQERNEMEKRQKRYLLDFMCAFRETFSRPVKPIRFLGLFDTVNSVPSFENAWMQRSKFPYTARSSARVIRHAVSIDERRAKFRQDLISQVRPNSSNYYKRRRREPASTLHTLDGLDEQRRGRSPVKPSGRRETLAVPGGTRDFSQVSAGMRNAGVAHTGLNSAATSLSNLSLDVIQNREKYDSDDEGEQDIKEVWFAGCHADIGGGWPLLPGEDAALSHVPLVWMVREAQRAGMQFDEIKLRALNCGHPESIPASPGHHETVAPVPTIALDTASPSPTGAGDRDLSPFGRPDSRNETEAHRSRINHQHHAATVSVEQHPGYVVSPLKYRSN
ncbi:short chain dehydrogenase reductase family [Paraphaeosphaeria sporulosa]